MGFFNAMRDTIVKMVKKVHVAIIFEDNKYYIRTKFVSKNGTTLEDRVYDKAGDKMPPIMVKYLNTLQKRHSHTYVSTFLSTINAGSIHSCDEREYHRMHIETDSIVKVCVDNQWSAYSSVYAIDELKSFFREAGGIDFIFPQEIAINYLLKSRGAIEGQQLFIITTSSYAVVTVFSDEGLLFSAHFLYKEDEDEVALDEELDAMDDVDEVIKEADKDSEEIEEVLQLEDIDDNDIFDGGLDDLDDLDDMEAPELDNIESFDADDDEELELEPEEPAESLFTRKDQFLCEFLHNSVEDFYKSSFYKSEFIQRAVVYDGSRNGNHTGDMLGRYIKEELFLECEVRPVDLCDLLADISMTESKAV